MQSSLPILVTCWITSTIKSGRAGAPKVLSLHQSPYRTLLFFFKCVMFICDFSVCTTETIVTNFRICLSASNVKRLTFIKNQTCLTYRLCGGEFPGPSTMRHWWKGLTLRKASREFILSIMRNTRRGKSSKQTKCYCLWQVFSCCNLVHWTDSLNFWVLHMNHGRVCFWKLVMWRKTLFSVSKVTNPPNLLRPCD